jgi:hypothetical protein
MVGLPGCRGGREEIRFKEQDTWTGDGEMGGFDGGRRRSVEGVSKGRGCDGQRRGAERSEGAAGWPRTAATLKQADDENNCWSEGICRGIDSTGAEMRRGETAEGGRQEKRRAERASGSGGEEKRRKTERRWGRRRPACKGFKARERDRVEEGVDAMDG